jgi:hypothetical protein
MTLRKVLPPATLLVPAFAVAVTRACSRFPPSQLNG